MNDPAQQEMIYAGCTRMRRELADWLPTLTPDQLATRSLCAEWTVREVAGHLVAALSVPTSRLLGRLLRSRFDLHRANAELAAEVATRPVAELAATLRERAAVELNQPVVGAKGPLTDLLVHDGDMRIPLGLPTEPDPELVEVALEFLVGGAPGFTPRSRLRGLQLCADESGRRWGQGAELRGRGADLMMAACGRSAVLDRLSGPGLAVLAGRLRP